jgi:hypothetical protein
MLQIQYHSLVMFTQVSVTSPVASTRSLGLYNRHRQTSASVLLVETTDFFRACLYRI